MSTHDYQWALECWREMMAKYKAGRPRRTKVARHDRETLEALDYAHQSEEALLRRAHAAEDLASLLTEVLRDGAVCMSPTERVRWIDRALAVLAKATGDHP
jgi:hypothetical protein